jgi:SNF2 family DNA or RNA helicase
MKDKLVDGLRKMPVITAVEKRKDQYVTFIHHIDKLRKICLESNIRLFFSEKVLEAEQRYKSKVNRIEKAKQNIEFNSSLWTDDQMRKVLPYQAQAINACLEAKRYLVGDDLGLGKTIETIGVICKAIEEGYDKFLIICPNRLKYQWKSEIHSFTKLEDEKVVVFDSHKKFICPIKITDSFNMRTQCCKECDRNEKCRRERYDPMIRFRSQIANKLISIINFEIVDRFKDVIVGQRFNGIFIDEASRMKNIKAITTKAIMKIVEEMPSDRIVVPMSGTFIENKIDEIYPSLTLVHKGLLGEFHNFQNNYLVKDYWGNVVGHRNESRLKKIINTWIIRRSVDEVWKDRPPLIEITETCAMTEIQRKIYLDAREGMLVELKDKIKQNKINMAEIGALLTYLIQICDSTETIDPEIKESGKLEVLKEKVENDIAQKHKVLIFSFFANKMIPIIIREMEKYGKCLSITGKVGAEKAEGIKKLFTEDKDYKFLICSDSMAYGANLQAARYVINFDLPWNPAKIDQRIRRVYRKGQKHTVTVFNLVTQGTVEDLILEKLSFKRKIFDKFLGSSLGSKPTMSVDDMLNILNKKPTF